jgi:hypothetical protein
MSMRRTEGQRRSWRRLTAVSRSSMGQAVGCLELYAERAVAGAALPISLRTLAADARDVVFQERLLCERLQQLLGIRNGSRPDDREACRLRLHCKSVDSVQGHPFFESLHLTSACSSFLPVA